MKNLGRFGPQKKKKKLVNIHSAGSLAANDTFKPML